MEEDLKTYLVVEDSNSGFAEINNVALVKANNEQEAREKYCSIRCGDRYVEIYDIEEQFPFIDYWMYYN